MLTAIFAFLGVFLGVVALATNYWTSGVSVIVPRENNANNTQFIGEMWNVGIYNHILILRIKDFHNFSFITDFYFIFRVFLKHV